MPADAEERVSKDLLTWAAGVAHGANGREYRVSHNSGSGLWWVTLGATDHGEPTRELAQQRAEDWETMQRQGERLSAKGKG